MGRTLMSCLVKAGVRSDRSLIITVYFVTDLEDECLGAVF